MTIRHRRPTASVPRRPRFAPSFEGPGGAGAPSRQMARTLDFRSRRSVAGSEPLDAREDHELRTAPPPRNGGHPSSTNSSVSAHDLQQTTKAQGLFHRRNLMAGRGQRKPRRTGCGQWLPSSRQALVEHVYLLIVDEGKKRRRGRLTVRNRSSCTPAPTLSTRFLISTCFACRP